MTPAQRRLEKQLEVAVQAIEIMGKAHGCSIKYGCLADIAEEALREIKRIGEKDK